MSSLQPIKGQAHRRQIATYDMEWYPDTMQLRVVGLYIDGRYHSFLDVKSFLAFVCKPQYRNHWFFAHAGGTADFAFLLEWFVKNPLYGFELEVAMANSAAVIVTIKRGKESWSFCDSFFLLRTSLRKIGESIGILKGNESQSMDQYYAPLSELIAYNEQDCLILQTALEQFQEEILELGGELQPTAASTSMSLFRRRFLKKPIETSPEWNLTLRQAYIASRVEVFRREILNAFQYDINSSFPASMTLPCPGDFLRSSKKLPDHDDERELFFGDVEISIPLDINVPPVPMKYKGKVWFPTGTWRSWFTGVDIRLVESMGGKITKVHQVAYYEPRDDLRDFVGVLYELRRVAKNDFRKDILKILLNSNYGKYGERPLKTKVHVFPRSLKDLLKLKLADGSPACYEYMPGVVMQKEEVELKHEHVPFAAYITARSRKLITDGIVWAGDCAYCDTDCIVTGRGDMVTSDVLGDYKLERRVAAGSFYAPKLYRIETFKKTEWGHDVAVTVKTKGFSRMNSETFDRLRARWQIETTRMVRPKEMLRSQNVKPRQVTFLKGLSTFVEKRFFYQDPQGQSWSRPFSVAEIHEGAMFEASKKKARNSDEYGDETFEVAADREPRRVG